MFLLLTADARCHFQKILNVSLFLCCLRATLIHSLELKTEFIVVIKWLPTKSHAPFISTYEWLCHVITSSGRISNQLQFRVCSEHRLLLVVITFYRFVFCCHIISWLLCIYLPATRLCSVKLNYRLSLLVSFFLILWHQSNYLNFITGLFIHFDRYWCVTTKKNNINLAKRGLCTRTHW